MQRTYIHIHMLYMHLFVFPADLDGRCRVSFHMPFDHKAMKIVWKPRLSASRTEMLPFLSARIVYGTCWSFPLAPSLWKLEIGGAPSASEIGALSLALLVHKALVDSKDQQLRCRCRTIGHFLWADLSSVHRLGDGQQLGSIVPG